MYDIYDTINEIHTVQVELTEEEQEESLVEMFKTLRDWNFERFRYHDSDGYFAQEAYSTECLALGHVKPEPKEGESYWYVEDDPLYEDGTHVQGWDSIICDSTKFGTACIMCEGECSYNQNDVNIWSLVK